MLFTRQIKQRSVVIKSTFKFEKVRTNSISPILFCNFEIIFETNLPRPKHLADRVEITLKMEKTPFWQYLGKRFAYPEILKYKLFH